MNKNKGVIGLGLILAIVLGIAVVGGGAYYLGKSDSKQKIKIKETQQSENQNNISQNKMLTYKTPCEISNISKQSFSFNYPEGYTIKEIKPEEGNVPLSGVMQITIQPKDNSAPIIIGPGFEVCDIGFKLCKNIGGIYRLSTINNSPEVELAYNQILSTIKSGTDCKNSSGKLVPINSTTENVSVASCTSDKGNSMTFQKALEIAEASSCNSIGKFTKEYNCNKNNGGLVDVYMEPTNKPGCGFACRVSIDTGKTEEGWMCTGALKPVSL